MFPSPLALQASATLSLSIIIPYFCTGIWIAIKDVSGEWHKYDLRNANKVKNPKPSRQWHHYTAHAWNQARDLFVFLPVGLYLICSQREETLYAPFKWQDLILMTFAYFVQQVWLMFVHYVLHTGFLYRTIHKHHHVAIDYVHSLSAWADSWIEYIVMELLSLIVIIYLAPMNVYCFAAIFVYLGHTSSIEHSGFYVNSYFDGRYHWTHHTRINYNYGELEFLDNMCGTLLVEDYQVGEQGIVADGTKEVKLEPFAECKSNERNIASDAEKKAA